MLASIIVDHCSQKKTSNVFGKNIDNVPESSNMSKFLQNSNKSFSCTIICPRQNIIIAVVMYVIYAYRVSPMVITAQALATLAFCVPKVCPPRQAINFFQERLLILNFTYQEYFCRLPNDKPFVPADYVAM